MSAISVWVDGRAFLEGPRWRADGLYVSDQHGHCVMRIDVNGSIEEIASVPECPSGLGFSPDGRLLIVSMKDRKLLRLDDGGPVEVADLSEHSPFEINDMVTTASGHSFVGQFGFDVHGGAAAQTSALLRVDPDGSVHSVADGMACANGMVVTEDEKTLIVAESGASKLTAFDLAADGSIANQRVWAELPHVPDGICLDAEGAIWVAGPVDDRFFRVREGGEVTDVLPVPGRHAIACALGGADGRTLYLLTSETLGNPTESAEKRASRIETTRASVPGVARP